MLLYTMVMKAAASFSIIQEADNYELPVSFLFFAESMILPAASSLTSEAPSENTFELETDSKVSLPRHPHAPCFWSTDHTC